MIRAHEHLCLELIDFLLQLLEDLVTIVSSLHLVLVLFDLGIGALHLELFEGFAVPLLLHLYIRSRVDLWDALGATTTELLLINSDIILVGRRQILINHLLKLILLIERRSWCATLGYVDLRAALSQKRFVSLFVQGFVNYRLALHTGSIRRTLTNTEHIESELMRILILFIVIIMFVYLLVNLTRFVNLLF